MSQQRDPPVDSGLNSANGNPCYVMLTLGGALNGLESQARAKEKIDRNRRLWHGWLSSVLSADQLKSLKDMNCVNMSEFAPLTLFDKMEIRRAIQERVGQNALVPFALTPMNFAQIHFHDGFDVSGFVFPVSINFSHARFENRARFRGALFMKSANFSNAHFTQGICFEQVTAQGPVTFTRAEFLGRVLLDRARFYSPVEFDAAKFGADPPYWTRCDFFMQSHWADVEWPKTPTKPDTASSFVDAYDRLKPMVVMAENPRDTANLNRARLMCLEIAGPHNLESYWARIYGMIAGYGFSYSKLLWALAINWIAGWTLISFSECVRFKCMSVGESILFALSNVFVGLTRGKSQSHPMNEEFLTVNYFSVGVSITQILISLIILTLLQVVAANRT